MIPQPRQTSINAVCAIVYAPHPSTKFLKIIQAHYQDAVSDTFQGIYAPAGTPKPVIDRLAKELTLILNQPDVREKFVKAGLPVVAEGPEVFRARIAREVPMYKDIIDKAGLKIQ